MRELILLGRISVANLEDFAWPGELQGRWNVVGGAERWTNCEREKFW